MRTIIHNGHKIEIKTFGTEKIYFDGQMVSKKNSMFGAVHVFTVTEGENEIQYEVDIGTRWYGAVHCSVRRNGKIIYTDR